MKIIVLLLMASIFISSCSADESIIKTERSIIDEFADETLKRVEVSLFRSNSNRAQPELINVYSEKSNRDYFIGWIKSTENKTTNVSTNINSIYILSFQYGKPDEVETQKRLAYVIDINNKVYIHELNDEIIRSLNELDTFKEGDQSRALNIIGQNNWYSVEQLNMNI